MNKIHKRDNLKFTFLEVKNSDMLKKVFEFRYEVMSGVKEFQEYFLTTDFKKNQDTDMYDQYSLHYVAVDESDNICANIRLIHNSPIGYPTKNGMAFDSSMFEIDRLGELSRIFIDAKYRNIKTTKIIMDGFKRFMYPKMMELGVDYTYGALELRFIRLLRMCNMQYKILGEEQLQGKMGFRYPCVLHTNQLGNDNPELIELWEKHCEVQSFIKTK